MKPLRRLLSRGAALSIALLLLAPALFVQAAGGPAAVTGQLTSKATIALSSSAVAVVVLVDQTASADGGSIIGLQRIDKPGTVPVSFSVPYDPATIQPKHAYALFASLQDGATVWQNLTAVPVITGGPTSNVSMPLVAVPSSPATTVSGSIVKGDKATLSAAAVGIAALIKVDTGTVVASQVLTTPATSLAFSMGYDAATVDPAATYVVRAAVVDGPAAWSGGAGTPVITNGAPTSGVSIPVIPSPTAIPTPQPTATAQPTATPVPTVKPTPKPTPKPSTTPKPTAKPTPTPTEKPTPTPTVAPTATPTAAPTASPTPTATASPSASPSPSPTPPASASASAKPSATPAAGIVTGTLTYAEPAQLSSSAEAVVLLVAGTASATSGTIVGSQVIATPGQKPIAFSVPYASKDIDPSLTYTIQADISDGDHRWETSSGVKVLTKGNPSTDVTVKLALQSDLLKGEVTGSITGVGIKLASGAYSATVLFRVDTGETIGVDVNPAPGAIPVPFSVAFDPATIDPNADYVVRSEIVSGDQRWADTNGVPVITKGNQLSGVSVVVTPVAAPSPSPTVAPSPAVQPPADTGGSSNWLWILIIILAIALAVALYMWYRNKQDDGPPPAGADPLTSQAHPVEAPSAEGTPTDGTSADAPPAEAPATDQPPIDEPPPGGNPA